MNPALRPLLFAVVTAMGLAAPSVALANPRPLPFTYPYGTLPEDALEVEQYVDITPVRAEEVAPDNSTNRVWDANYVLQTELEYGITDHLELGTYLQFKQGAAASDPSMHFDGIKERLRYRIGEEGDLPIDPAVYFELAQFHDELELEEKIILEKRIGALRAMANLWVEQELERGKDAAFVFNPTVGVTYRLHDKVYAGIEYWTRGRFHRGTPADPIDDFNTKTHHFLGPAVSLQFGRLWWSIGVYGRLDQLNRVSQPGDDWGKVWIRSVIGLDL